MNSTPINRKLVEQSISKSAKKVIAESGMHPSTRSGSKELEHLVKRLAEQPFNTVTAAIQAGEELGQKIVELSQQTGKQNLDKSIIRQLMLKKQFPTASSSQATAPNTSRLAQSQEQSTPAKAVTKPLAQLESTTEPEDAAQAVVTPAVESEAVSPAIEDIVEPIVEPIEASGDVSVYETMDEATDDDGSGEEKATNDVTDESEEESSIADEALESEALEVEVGAIDDTEDSAEQIDELNRLNASTELNTSNEIDAADDLEVDGSDSTVDMTDASAQASSTASIAADENSEYLLEADTDTEPAEIESNAASENAIDDEPDDADDELDDAEDDLDDADSEINKTTATEEAPQPKATTRPLKTGK
jgi:hypothetical protein